MMKGRTSVAKAVAALAATAVALGLGLGCTAVGTGRPATPYRPLARPVVILPIVKPVPEAAPAVTPTPGETNEMTETTEALGVSERVLRSGDRLVVTIHAPPEPFTSQHVVDEAGRINLPYIGVVTVAGKSCSRAQQEIEKRYIDEQYYKNVTVIIVPPESEYSVSGEVLRPGPYPLTRNLTVLQALGRAGRFTDYADQSRVYLIRGNDRTEIKLSDINEGRRRDVVVIPGDVIEVPRSKW